MRSRELTSLVAEAMSFCRDPMDSRMLSLLPLDTNRLLVISVSLEDSSELDLILVEGCNEFTFLHVERCFVFERW